MKAAAEVGAARDVVPPDVVRTQRLELRRSHTAATSGESGEPVVPSARMRVRSPQSASTQPRLHAVGKEGGARTEET